MPFMHYDHKIKHGDDCKYVHIHIHLSITIYTIANLPKIDQQVTDISEELMQNLYIQLQKRII